MNYRLSFSGFVDYIREHLLEGWREDREIRIQKVKKNNGLELTGVMLPCDDIVATPTFYMEDLYKMYCEECMEMDQVIGWLRCSFEEAEHSVEDVRLDELLDYQNNKDHIIFRIVHYERNREMLSQCPFIRIHDLAVTFRTVVSWDSVAISSALVTHDHMQIWGISMDELVLRAQENTRRIFPPDIFSMNDFLRRHGQDPLCGADMMYVATNRQMMNGASVILYEGLLEGFAARMDCSFYILPSSIHELLFVPDYGLIDVDSLARMVEEANSNVVEKEELLSYSVYYYDRDEHKMKCVASR